MDSLQWCSLFLTLVSLSCNFGSNVSDCVLRLPDKSNTIIHCRSGNSSSGIYILITSYTRHNQLGIRCDDRLNFFDLEIQKFYRTHDNSNSESCQFLGVKHINFIKIALPIKRITHLAFAYVNMDVALNISRSILSDLKNIEVLYIFGINFSDISSDHLQEFGEQLSLELSRSSFGKLSKYHSILTISSLFLWENNLVVIDSNTFGEIKDIHSLNIKENTLHRIMPNSFDKMVTLASITIESGRLQNLPEKLFASLQNLTVFDITENNFSEDTLDSKVLQNHSGLVKLQLSKNKKNLRTLPNRFLANMTHLQEVIMTRNGLVTLPADLFSGSVELLSIDFQYNKIESLPDGIFSNQSKLNLLDLSHNNIYLLPDSMLSNQKNLNSLNLSYNKIYLLQYGIFSNQKSLKSLNLSNNRIANISSSAFEGSRSIGDLNMNMNISIERLDISNNEISQMPQDWLFFNNLRHLNLGYNELDKFSSNDIRYGFFNLTIDLTNNGIKTISIANDKELGEFNSSRSKNVFIDVDRNPIECDCQVYDLLAHLEKEMDPSLQNSFYFNMNPFERRKGSLKEKLLLCLESETLTCLISESHMINTTCPEKCECWRRPSNLTYIIDCSNRGLGEAPEKIRGPAKYQIELNLTNNLLTKMPSLSQPGYEKVTVLILSHNNIENVPPQSLLKNLRILELDNNKLSKIDASILELLRRSPNLKKLTLHNNLWECNCEQKGFLKFIQATRSRLVDLNNVACGEMEHMFYLTLSEDLCSDHRLIVSCIGIALFGIIIAMYYRYQQEIKIWLYARQWCLWLVSENELDRDKIYDAFISYSHQDDDFVVNELVAKLEEGSKPFKLCVHYRDWLPGEYIPNQVACSVENSKRTLIVLSANFIHSEWGRMEFRAAHSQALSDGRTRVIVIIYGEIPPLEDLDSELRAYLTMNTYVKWGDPWFWRKLRYALPHRS